jgi:hypothetical protein
MLKDLQKSKNPFNGLTIYHYPLMDHKDDFFNVLLALARIEGLKNSLLRIKEKEQNKKYSEMFNKNKLFRIDCSKYWPNFSTFIDTIVNPK